MALDYRQGNKVMKSQRREEAPGTRVDPHPYIGIVMNNLDPTRCGRLQVWIPDLGGDQNDSKNWRTASYSSPFMGTTNITPVGTNGSPNETNKYGNTPNTYGMWMVPPDIGVEVIVVFIAGDPMRGYWIGCINSHISRYMIPAIAGSTNVDLSGASADVTKSYQQGTPAPVTEFNENNKDTYQQQSFTTNPKPIHEPQYNILKVQGLDRDTTRGVITSSSQRETPSNVFGISTPGRPYPDNGAENPEAFLAKVQAGTLTEADYTYTTRRGGHTFLMDDGSITGVDQLIRLRTGKGHQLMMHDTDNSIYIGHADGTSWVELDSNGAVNIFATNGFNVRTTGSLNFHADQDINFNAVNNINIASSGLNINNSTTTILTGALNLQSSGSIGCKSGSTFIIDAGATVSIKSGGTVAYEGSLVKQNSGGTQSISALASIPVNSLPDVSLNSATGLYVSNPGVLNTIVTVAPTHEPYARGAAPYAATTSPGLQPSTYTGTQDATKNTGGTVIKNPATATDLRNQPKCDCSVGNLTSDQLTAYYTTIGKSESGGKYDVVNSIGFVGKYQFGYPALIDGGYVSKTCKSNAQLKNPNMWSPNKNGIDSLTAWLANGPEQEAAMCAYTKRNYTAMVKIGAVTSDQSPADVAGMLAVAHLLGPGGAKNYRNGQSGSDAYGTTGADYFAKGQYAVAVLAPQISTLDQAPSTTV